MSQETEQQILQALHDIRDGQQEIIKALEAQRALADAQIQKSRTNIEESIGLQREALRRQRAITRIAIPGILACIAAIAYLVFRYF
jgi:hypothetical protein